MLEIVLEICTVSFPIIIGYFIWLLKNRKKERDANSKGTLLLLRAWLIEQHDKYMEKGDISPEAYENFMAMYDAYCRLDENEMITKMCEEIKVLHLSNKGAK